MDWYSGAATAATEERRSGTEGEGAAAGADGAGAVLFAGALGEISV